MSTPSDRVGPIVIACAMQEEAQPFLTALSASEDVALPPLPPKFQGPLKFTGGLLFGKPAIVAVTGIGMTNAALAATLIALEVAPSLVVFAGTTGGLGVGVQVGDVIIGTSALYHDADATDFGYLPGQIPQMPPDYAADPEWGAQAEAGVRASGIPYHAGQISASNSFVSGDRVEPVRAVFPGVLAIDMETAAGAQVCWSFRVPWVSLRAVSDLCEPSAGEVFVGAAAHASQRSFSAVEAALTHTV